ncbi:hypothetical protein SAMN05444392_10769 [Seinonella peptonophila]|uniref:Polymerase nucleotidyl transferase domain-containing protein n=1 Tax=Seinonella peptonophila TaxID=112248 RepID=A0A1M4YQG5_9BACL|nr:nucleotidyltransferase family protein [Seinonella peptonophila]SHF07576.1 hypothetical protein SAMN05444392_10769 [Seinonella peptonophila]
MLVNNLNDSLKKMKLFLRDSYGVKKIGYFGSYVRGEQTEKSDIDLLVEFSKPIGLRFVELKEHLERELGKNVDLVTTKALKPQLREAILNEVIYL